MDGPRSLRVLSVSTVAGGTANEKFHMVKERKLFVQFFHQRIIYLHSMF